VRSYGRILHGLSKALHEQIGVHTPARFFASRVHTIKWYGIEAKCLAIWLYQRHPGMALERKAILAEEFAKWEPKVFHTSRVTARMWELFGKDLP
jgi:hypothetical protein